MSPPTLPPELLLEIIAHLSGPPLASPSPSSISALLSLSLTSHSLSAPSLRALYSAISLSTSRSLLLFTYLTPPYPVRALYLSRSQLGRSPEDLPACSLLLHTHSQTLERVVYDAQSPLFSCLDSYLSSMPLLREVAFTRQATELLGLDPTYLEPCPGVKRLALHDYWADGYHLLRICGCFPAVQELVLAAEVSPRLVGEIVDQCRLLRRVVILRPYPRVLALSNAYDTERDRSLRSAELRKREVAQEWGRERGARIVEVAAPEEGKDLPRWEAECIKDGECWALEGVDWASVGLEGTSECIER